MGGVRGFVFAWLAGLAASTAGGAGGVARAEAPLRIAAASDLARAFGEVGALYERQSGDKVTITFGSSGLLARQLEEGAPFDLFAAANQAYVDEAVGRGACRKEDAQRYARGRLAIWSSGALPGAPAELAQPRWRKIAIANPAHAPYGRAAVQALEHLAIAEAVKPRLVYGENVQQALQFAQSGNADVALVALSLVIGGERPYLLVDDRLHDPIVQALVVCGKDAARAARARAFVRALRSPEGAAILLRYGFEVPVGPKP